MGPFGTMFSQIGLLLKGFLKCLHFYFVALVYNMHQFYATLYSHLFSYVSVQWDFLLLVVILGQLRGQIMWDYDSFVFVFFF